jgi:hypothetical protein
MSPTGRKVVKLALGQDDEDKEAISEERIVRLWKSAKDNAALKKHCLSDASTYF